MLARYVCSVVKISSTTLGGGGDGGGDGDGDGDGNCDGDDGGG